VLGFVGQVDERIYHRDTRRVVIAMLTIVQECDRKLSSNQYGAQYKVLQTRLSSFIWSRTRVPQQAVAFLLVIMYS
jgi:hypothetical protein